MTEEHTVSREDLVVIGRLSRAYGLNGEIRFTPASDTADWIFTKKESDLFLLAGNVAPQCVRAKVRRRPGGFCLAAIAGVTTPEDAGKYSGMELAVHHTARPVLPEGEYYLDQLQGLSVIDPHDHAIGRVKRIIEARSGDFLEIETSAGTYLIPPEKNLIEFVDLARQVIKLKQDLL